MMDTQTYNFTVSQSDMVDIQRICDEADPSRMALLVMGPKNAIVLLRKEFTYTFNTSDGIPVGGENLADGWGYPTIMFGVNHKFSAWEGKSALDGWRGRIVALGEIRETIEQISAALQFRRRLKIVVKGFCR